MWYWIGLFMQLIEPFGLGIDSHIILLINQVLAFIGQRHVNVTSGIQFTHQVYFIGPYEIGTERYRYSRSLSRLSSSILDATIYVSLFGQLYLYVSSMSHIFHFKGAKRLIYLVLDQVLVCIVNLCSKGAIWCQNSNNDSLDSYLVLCIRCCYIIQVSFGTKAYTYKLDTCLMKIINTSY